MSDQVKIISRFLRQEQGSKSVVRYVLRHAAKGKNGTEVESFEITESLSPEELDLLAASIHDRAQMDADGIGPTVQRYTITSYLKDEKVTGRLAFRCKGSADLDFDEESETGEEDAPTNRGLMQQLMRHNEANNRTLMNVMGATLTSMARRMESSDRMIEKLQEERRKEFEIIENARSQEAERQLLLESERAKQARYDIGFKKIAQLAPVALSHFTGGKLEAKDTAFSLMLKELVSGMSEEQFMAIARTLKPEQQIAFFRMIQMMKEQAKESKTTEGESNGVS